MQVLHQVDYLDEGDANFDPHVAKNWITAGWNGTTVSVHGASLMFHPMFVIWSLLMRLVHVITSRVTRFRDHSLFG